MRIGSALYRTQLHCKAMAIAKPLRPHSWRTHGRALALISLAIMLVGCAKKEAGPPAAPEVEIAAVMQEDVPQYTEVRAIVNSVAWMAKEQIDEQVGPATHLTTVS